MTFRKLLWTAFALVAVSLAGCAGSSMNVKPGETKTVVAGDPVLAPPDTTSSGGVYTGVPDYRIGPMDVIEISVFQVPDLNKTVRVNSAGQISLPLIGVIQAGGSTIQELEKTLATKLDAKYLQNPQVTAFVKEYASQRVTIEGAVRAPGVFPLTGRTTLLQSIAQAGGLDPLANPKGIVIFRQIGGKKMAAVFDLKMIRAGDAQDPLIYGDDIIVVDQSGAKTAVKRIIETMPILNMFTIY